MSSVQWDDGNVARRRDDRVKFNKDKVDRICVMDQTAEMKWTHYLGGYVECTAMVVVDETDPETNQPIKVTRPLNPCKIHPLCDREPDERFGAHILVYTTDRDGMPLSPLNFSMKWWAFGQQHFKTLRVLRKQFGDIRMRDLIITCTNTDYQHLQITPANDAWWLSNEAFKQMVAERYKAACQSMDIGKLLATHVPIEKQDEYIEKAQEREKKYGGKDNKKDKSSRRDRDERPPDASGIVFPGGSMQMGQGSNPFAGMNIPTSPFAAPLPPSMPSLPASSPSSQMALPLPSSPPAAPNQNPTSSPSLGDLDALLGKLNQG